MQIRVCLGKIHHQCKLQYTSYTMQIRVCLKMENTKIFASKCWGKVSRFLLLQRWTGHRTFREQKIHCSGGWSVGQTNVRIDILRESLAVINLDKSVSPKNSHCSLFCKTWPGRTLQDNLFHPHSMPWWNNGDGDAGDGDLAAREWWVEYPPLRPAPSAKDISRSKFAPPVTCRRNSENRSCVLSSKDMQSNSNWTWGTK